MANEFEITTTAGTNVYVVLRNPSGQVWNGSAFVTFADANIATYAIALTQQGTASGYYSGDFPTTITTPCLYNAVAYKRSGGSPAVSDTALASGNIQWNGSSTYTYPSGNNLITLAFAKEYIGISVTTYDSLLSDLIAEASLIVNEYCNRTFTLTTYSEYYDIFQPSYGLILKKIPITAISTIVLNPNTVYSETVQGSQYIYSSYGEVQLLPTSTSTAIFPTGFRSVQANYTAGFATIPISIQGATAEMVKNLYYLSTNDTTKESEKLGDYSYARRKVDNSLLTPEITAVLDRYKLFIV